MEKFLIFWAISLAYPLIGAALQDKDDKSEAADTGGGHTSEVPTSLQIVTFKWHHVQEPYIIALWILVASLAKIGESHFYKVLNYHFIHLSTLGT